MRWMVLMLAVAACGGRSAPTVPLALRLRPLLVDGAAIVWDEATWDVRLVRVRGCGEETEQTRWAGVPVSATTFPALQDPAPASVGFDASRRLVGLSRTRIPVGPWCRLEALVEGPLRLSGRLDDGGTLDAEVELPDLGMPFDAQFAIPNRRDVAVDLVLELGNATWLDAVSDDLVAGVDVTVVPGGDAHTRLETALVAGAALYLDPDGDGAVDEASRDDDRVLGLTPL